MSAIEEEDAIIRYIEHRLKLMRESHQLQEELELASPEMHLPENESGSYQSLEQDTAEPELLRCFKIDSEESEGEYDLAEGLIIQKEMKTAPKGTSPGKDPAQPQSKNRLS